MNPFRLGSILLVTFALSVSLLAQKIVVLGATPEQCTFATKPLLQDLTGIAFPKDWTIAVACTPAVWERLQRKRDDLNTVTAFTNLKGRLTVLNGGIYLQSLPLQGTIHRTPRVVLKHEYGHILCNCDDEAKADEAADRKTIGQLSDEFPRAFGVAQDSAARSINTVTRPCGPSIDLCER